MEVEKVNMNYEKSISENLPLYTESGRQRIVKKSELCLLLLDWMQLFRYRFSKSGNSFSQCPATHVLCYRSRTPYFLLTRLSLSADCDAIFAVQ